MTKVLNVILLASRRRIRSGYCLMQPKEEGVAKVQGLMLHVANAEFGEHVKIKLNRIGGTTAEQK